MADGHENAVDDEFARLLRFGIAKAHPFHEALRCKDFFDDKRRDEFRLLILFCAVNHDFGSPKFLPAVNQANLTGITRKKVGFFHRGIAAPDDSDWFPAKEIAVAGGTGGNPVADQLSFAFQPEQTSRRPRGDNHGFRFVGMFSRDDLEGALVEVDFRDGASLEFGAEFLRLLAHVFNKLRPKDSVREAGEIFDVRGEGKLAAGLMAVNNERLEVRARGINRGGKTCATTANDYDVVHSILLRTLDTSLRPPDTAAVL